MADFTLTHDGFVDLLRENAKAFKPGTPFLGSTWANLCIRAISGVMVSIPGAVVDEEGQPSTDKQAQWLGALLEKPNELQDRSGFLEASSTFYDADGGVFWLFERGGQWWDGNVNTPPDTVWPISHKTMRASVEGRRLRGWLYTGDGAEKLVPLSACLRFAYCRPDNLLRAYSPAEVTQLAIDADHSAQVFNKTFFDNGTFIGGTVRYPGVLTNEQAEQIRKQFRDKHSGPEHAGEPLVLGSGAEFVENGRSHHDMQYLDLRKFSRDEIFAIYRVPKTLGGIYEDVNYATHLGQMRVFFETVILPRLRSIETALFAAFGLRYKFDLSGVECLRDGRAAQIDQAKKLWDMGVPLNDAAQAAGLVLPEYEWGKTWWKPFGLEDVQAPAAPETSAPLMGFAPQAAPAVRIVGRRRGVRLIHEHIIRAVFTPGEKVLDKLYRALIRGVFDETRDNLKRLSGKGVRVRAFSPEEVVFELAKWQGWLQKHAPEAYRQVGGFALAELEAELGTLDFGVNDPRFVEFLRRKIVKAKSIVETMHGALKAEVQAFLDGAETIQDLADRIEHQFGVTSTRAITIARTEAGQTVNGSRFMGMVAEGVTTKLWSTSEDEKVRPTHVKLGTVDPVPVDHDWADDIHCSGKLLYPGDMRAPGKEVINCRCVALALD